MKVIVGTELGPIKVINAEKGTLIGNISVPTTASALCWMDAECRLFAAAIGGGRILMCDAEALTATLVSMAPLSAFKSKRHCLDSVCRLLAPVPDDPESVVSVYDNGAVVVHPHVVRRAGTTPHIKKEPEAEPSETTTTTTGGEEEGKLEAVPYDEATLRRGGTSARVVVPFGEKPVHCAAMGRLGRQVRIAMGGQDNNVRVYDQATGAAIWHVANMPADPRTKLCEKVWPSTLVFLPEGTHLRIEKSQSQRADEALKAQQEMDQLIIKRLVKNGVPLPGVDTPCRRIADNPIVYETKRDSHILVVGTRYNRVRLYDVCNGKKNLTNLSVAERPLNCMTLDTTDPQRVLFGTTTGEMFGLNVNTQSITGAFRGVSSAIRMCRSAGNVFVSCALDRFLRVYDLRKRSLISRIHIKLMPTAMIISGETFETEVTKKQEVESIWQELDETPFAPVPDDKPPARAAPDDAFNGDSDDDSAPKAKAKKRSATGANATAKKPRRA